MDKVYICIDLKTFFASVECVERGLDPFKTKLVVADEERGNGTICLAVSPLMKQLGVKNRCRLFEIPKNMEYIIAKPRMKKYIEYAANIYAIYLKYIDKTINTLNINYNTKRLDALRSSYVLKNPLVLYEVKEQKLDNFIDRANTIINKYNILTF